jgi:hypothetical protein
VGSACVRGVDASGRCSDAGVGSSRLAEVGVGLEGKGDAGDDLVDKEYNVVAAVEDDAVMDVVGDVVAKDGEAGAKRRRWSCLECRRAFAVVGAAAAGAEQRSELPREGSRRRGDGRLSLE